MLAMLRRILPEELREAVLTASCTTTTTTLVDATIQYMLQYTM